MSGELVYFEIPAADTERAREFYGNLFGWHFEEGDSPGYFVIFKATTLNGSKSLKEIGGLKSVEESSNPQVFFNVEDIDAEINRVRELGGEADNPRKVHSGYYARCRDDQGIPFAMWKLDN